jgi:hypothetical protein
MIDSLPPPFRGGSQFFPAHDSVHSLWLVIAPQEEGSPFRAARR